MATDSYESYQFVNAFRATLTALGSLASFEPRYKFKDMRDQVNRKFLEKHCFAKGKYCVPETEDNFDRSTPIVFEGVRQICIWEYDKAFGTRHWWSYVQAYEKCLRGKQQGTYSNVSCHQIIQQDSVEFRGIEHQVNKCISDSFDDPKAEFSSENKLLAAHANPLTYEGQYLVPVMFINGQMTEGELVTLTVLSGVCDVLSKRPSMCDVLQMIHGGGRGSGNLLSKLTPRILACLLTITLLTITTIIMVIRNWDKGPVTPQVVSEVQRQVADTLKSKSVPSAKISSGSSPNSGDAPIVLEK